MVIKGTVAADDYRRENLEDVGIKLRATDIYPIDIARSVVNSEIRLSLTREKLHALGNGKFEELENLSSPEGVSVVLELKDEKLNISSEIRVDSMKISLEDSTFAKLDELIGEENYQIFLIMDQHLDFEQPIYTCLEKIEELKKPFLPRKICQSS